MNITDRSRHWLDKIFPGHCQLCSDKIPYNEMICIVCKQALPWLKHTCQRCAVPMINPNQGICGQCQSHAPYYDQVYSLFYYRQPVSKLIIGLKFHHRLTLARLLGHLMAEYLLNQMDASPEAIIPVPLHPRRMRERGFNQACELARTINKRWDIKVRSSAVERLQDNPPQVTLSRKQRLINTRGAFRICERLPKRHLLIIDDVMTTGATVNELARILKHEGIERVDVLTLARAEDA